MQSVEPIRDKKVIEKMKGYLKSRGTRDYSLFVLGINSGLRISDLLNLKVADVVSSKGKVKERISIVEKKTGKVKEFPVGSTALKALKEHLEVVGYDRTDCFLFQSRKGDKPITRVQAWRILNNAARAGGLDEDSIGTHTMRKTFGYHAYTMGMDLSLVQDLLNHSSPGVTLAYIGISRDDRDKVYLNLNL